MTRTEQSDSCLRCWSARCDWAREHKTTSTWRAEAKIVGRADPVSPPTRQCGRGSPACAPASYCRRPAVKHNTLAHEKLEKNQLDCVARDHLVVSRTRASAQSLSRRAVATRERSSADDRTNRIGANPRVPCHHDQLIGQCLGDQDSIERIAVQSRKALQCLDVS